MFSFLKKQRHEITVTTYDVIDAETDSLVYVALYDVNGVRSAPVKLDKPVHDDLKQNATDAYQGPNVEESFGDLAEIELWRDDQIASSDWCFDTIRVLDRKTKVTRVFPVQRWLEKDMKIMIPVNHTSLPQHDPHPEQRADTLKYKRQLYAYEEKFPGLPVMVKKVPQDRFTDLCQSDMSRIRMEIEMTSKSTELPGQEKWKSFDDMRILYKSKVFNEPKGLKYYRDDLWFAAQRVGGNHPYHIRLCQTIPDNFQVTDEMVSVFLEGQTLSEAAANRKLFLVNHTQTQNLKFTDPEREIASPMALFYLRKDDNITPIAIQLRQEPTPDNPVFLPSDPDNLWLLAKLWFNMADVNIEEIYTHLAQKHLMMAGVCLITHHNLAVNHPLFRLMAPHFQYDLLINKRAVDHLLEYLDQQLQVKMEGALQLAVIGFNNYELNTNGCPVDDLKNRGVDDPSVLPVYPYRDDALPIYNAIKTYVSKIINHYYDTEDKLTEDKELHMWAKALVAPRPEGLGLKGIPGDGKFENNEDLIKVLSTFIYTTSVAHAITLVQYDIYAFPGNAPNSIHAKMPRNKNHVPTEEELVQMLPEMHLTLDMMLRAKAFTFKSSKSLGYFDIQYQHDDIALEAVKEFQDELRFLSKEAKKKNKNRSDMFKYEILDPVNIPNSITI